MAQQPFPQAGGRSLEACLSAGRQASKGSLQAEGMFASRPKVAVQEQQFAHEPPPRAPKSEEVRSRASSQLNLGAVKVGGGKKGETVTVIVRVRPKLRHREEDESDCITVHNDGKTLSVTEESGDSRQFMVDCVVDSRKEQCTQSYLYACAGLQLAHEALKGINVCIFAYGHTGSGKTYTMIGDGSTAAAAKTPDVTGEGAGLLPRIVCELFSNARQTAQSGRGELHARCEYYEVYNEQIWDLLAPKDSNRARAVRVHPKHGVHIETSAHRL
jgi:hypothetical protein